MTGATRGTWHATHDACRSCGRTDSPHEARGLCHSCYSYLARAGELWRYPDAAPRGTAARAHAARAAHRAAKWRRERFIAWRPTEDPRPFIAACEPGGRPLPDLRGVR